MTRRETLGLIVMGIMAKTLRGGYLPEIGILYSSATGIVLRSINPDDNSHLDWLEQNKPEGTSLLRISKYAVGADHHSMPNLDYLIPYAAENHGVALRFGEPRIINGHLVLCCPVLAKKALVS